MTTDAISQLVDRGFDLVETGQLLEARRLFEQVCAQDSRHAEAWMMRGSVNAELGNIDQALAALRTAIELDPSMPESFYYLANIQRSHGELEGAAASIDKALALDNDYGEAFLLGGAIYGMLGQFDQSERYCRRAAELLPTSVDAHFNLGNVLLQRGNINDACQSFSLATQLHPGVVEAWAKLGRGYAMLGDPDRSVDAYQKVLQLQPDSAEACYGLGFAEYQRGAYQEAAAHFSRALELNPQYTDAANSLGMVYQVMGRYQAALDVFERMLLAQPNLAEALFGKARALIELGRQPEAVPLLQQAVQIKPDYTEAALNLAATLMSFERLQEAMQYCEQVLETQPVNPDAIALLARIELQAGEVARAHRRLSPHILASSRHINLNVAYSDVCLSMGRPDEAITALESLIDSGDKLSAMNRRTLHFSLGKLYDKIKRYDDAFRHFAAGNALKGQTLTWDAAVNAAQIDGLIRVFSREFLATAQRATQRSDKPVFIVGMPRSGTSLVEQILASHPAVFGAGELTDLLSIAQALPAALGAQHPFPQCVTALNTETADRFAQRYIAHLDALSANARRVTDKMPGNFSFLGLIQLLFPDARIIHCVRDPLDTCLSCYFQDFAMSQPYSYQLEHLGAFYRDYQRLMAHWKSVLDMPLLEVMYEDLVSDQEAASRRMIEFCGLEWDPRCLQFHESGRYVATSSYDQVRRPIYKSSVKRWEHYSEHLDPLRDALR